MTSFSSGVHRRVTMSGYFGPVRVANSPVSAGAPALFWKGFFVLSTFWTWTGAEAFSELRASPPERNRPGTSPAYAQEVSPGFKQARLGDLALPVPSTWTLTQAKGDYGFVGKDEGVRARVLSLSTPAPDLALLAAAEREVRTLGSPAVLRRIKSISLPAGTAWLAKFRVGASRDPGDASDRSTDCLACLLPRAGRVALVLLWAPHGTDHRQRWQTMLQGLRWL
jgi:hypothetical protein